jgi:hypothetical protein
MILNNEKEDKEEKNIYLRWRKKFKESHKGVHPVFERSMSLFKPNIQFPCIL